MFLLDTNVLSAVLASRLSLAVAAWLNGTPERLLCTATICQAEILAGIAILPEGQRSRRLNDAPTAIFDEDFAGKVLPFDRSAALVCGEIYARRRRAGRHVEPTDLMIAAIALAHGADIVTRNVRILTVAASPSSIPGR